MVGVQVLRVLLDKVLTGFGAASLQPNHLLPDGPNDGVDIGVGRLRLFASGARPSLAVRGGRRQVASGRAGTVGTPEGAEVGPHLRRV